MKIWETVEKKTSSPDHPDWDQRLDQEDYDGGLVMLSTL